MPQLAREELPADDVEQHRDRHQRDAQHHAPEIEVGGAEEDQRERDRDVHREAHGEHRDRDRKARQHARADFVTDAATVIRVAEIEPEELHRLLKEDRLGERVDAAGRRVAERGYEKTILYNAAAGGGGAMSS